MKRLRVLISAMVFALVVSILPTALGGIHETFDGPETSWLSSGTDCRGFRVVTHERRFADQHSGQGCEFIQFTAGQGTSIYFAHPIPAARVIEELAPSVWVKSDRRGIQLLARVVFPRSLDRSGKPLTGLLLGDSYDATGSWRQLRIDDLPLKVQREVVTLRTQPNIHVDEREAYIDRLVLNVYAGPGTTNVWIDDLDVNVFATSSDGGPKVDSSVAAPNVPSVASTVLGPTSNEPNATLQGNLLIANGRPCFVRAVEHRGETLAFLQSLGFNAVLLKTAASDALLNEAQQTGMWLIAPPPLPDAVTGIEISPSHRSVLLWYAGEQLAGDHEELVTQMVQQLRHADGPRPRPMAIHPSSSYSRFRHEQSVMLLEHPIFGTSFDLRDFGAWLADSALYGRRDAQFWAVIPSELPSQLQSQIQRLSETTVPLCVEPDALRLAAFEAVARGARGLYFRSSARLDGLDPGTKRRAAALHALNCELEVLAPWAAGGVPIGEKITDNPHVRVLTLQTDSSRLLIVTRPVSDQQYVVSSVDPQPVSFMMHAVPLSDQAYLIGPQGVAPVDAHRGGGVRLSISSVSPVSLVMLTQDPLAVNYVGRAAAEVGRKYAGRQIELLEMLLEETELVSSQTSVRPAGFDRNRHQTLTQARVDLNRAKQLLESGDARHAIEQCEKSWNACRRLRRAQWESSVLSFPSPISSPLCTTFATLGGHRALAGVLSNATWSINRLAAGEMEHLEHLLQSGWRQNRTELPDINTDVRLSLDSPRSGRASLQMRAWRESGSRGRTDGEWPVFMTSAPFPVQQGELLRIHGWAKVPRPFTDSWDGLMIFDSQTGPAMAERITETQGWREFTLYRVANATGDMQLIFAHTGIGESWLDDISVEAVEGTRR